jgi:hypothetical protein
LIQSQIACSSELQNQKIIVLSMTRHEKEELEIKHIKSFEPAIAEKKMKKKKQKQKQREELMQTIFSLVDESKIGQLNLLHLFFEMSSNEYV